MVEIICLSHVEVKVSDETLSEFFHAVLPLWRWRGLENVEDRKA